jgi:hypothetical protein
MATFTSGVEGTFTFAEFEHLMQQVRNLPKNFDEEAVRKEAGYERYDYNAGRLIEATRRFKGKVTISVEELPFQGIPHKEPDAPDPDA